jgi:hypothetical protein
VNLVEVDVLGTEAAQAGVELGEDRLAGQAATVGPDAIGSHTFVAITTSSRRVYSPRARPKISSLVPSE